MLERTTPLRFPFRALHGQSLLAVVAPAVLFLYGSESSR
jgi:hypothetical protein